MTDKITYILYLAFTLLLLCPNAAPAGNYPDRDDFLWVTVPDHADWLYKTGEKAAVEVQLYKYGMPVDCELTYTISPDMLEPISNGSVKMKNGRASVTIGTRRTPGFLDLKLTASVAGRRTSHHVKVGYGVERIQPFTRMPQDFADFWRRTIDEARKTPVAVTRVPAPEYTTDKTDCWLVKIHIDRSHCMYGYLTMPRNAAPGRHPVVLCPPGAGVKTIKEPLRHSYYAEAGMVRLELEIHGLDPRLGNDTFKDISSAFGGAANGYLVNAIDSRDRYYMRHVYAGMVRCIDYLTSLPEWDGRNVAVQGGSQGGALALVTAALDPRVTLCVANHPALADMAAYSEQGRTGGYPHLDRNPAGILTQQVIKALEYYDVTNFCRVIKCPVRMTWGYNDNTCPPTTSYAAWNVMNCPKDPLITPINEHWTSEATERQHKDWIMQRLK